MPDGHQDAMPEVRFRVSRRTHGEVTRKASAVDMRLGEYMRALVSTGILEPEERVREVEQMKAEIERLQALTDHLRRELKAARERS